MGDTRCTYGGAGAWSPSYGGGSHGLSGKASYDPTAMAPSYGPHRLHTSYGGGGAWNSSYGGGGGGGAWNPSHGGGSHGLPGKASYDPTVMAPSYGPHRLHTSYSGGGAWNSSYVGGGSAWNPSCRGGSHGLSGKASYDPTAMAPSYGPHRLHHPARHCSTPYDPPADARPRLATIPAKAPDADLFWMDHCHAQDWNDGDDDDDDDDRQPTICEICNRESDHVTMACPFFVLTRHLDVFRNPPKKVSYYFYRVENTKTNGGTYGRGFSLCFPSGRRNVEHCAADAMMLHKDGMNLVRITNVPKEITKPEPLYKLFVEIGPLTHVVVLPDQALAFVNFVSEEAAQTAIKLFNYPPGSGHLMWATERP